VSYLGHVISAAGVAMDEQKVRAVREWPVPHTVHAVHAFLGLTGYYRHFIQGYGSIAAPLTALLRKDAFRWSPEVETTFHALQRALTMTQCYSFRCSTNHSLWSAMRREWASAPFYIKVGAPSPSSADNSAPHHAKLAAYECELIGLVQAVHHWRPYMWGRVFVVKTDHYSLKFLLDQRMSTIPQHQWASKLLGFDFTV
jgi:hypothetical protein